jgi:hypothetical protein
MMSNVENQESSGGLMSDEDKLLSAFIGKVEDATDVRLRKAAASLIAKGEARLVWYEDDELYLMVTAKGWRRALGPTNGDA